MHKPWLEKPDSSPRFESQKPVFLNGDNKYAWMFFQLLVTVKQLGFSALLAYQWFLYFV